jgi:hypothetical protein
MALITAEDIQARVLPTVYLRLFDRNKTGHVDAAYLATCIASGDSRAQMKCAAYFDAAFDAPGGTVDEAIKGAIVAYVCLEAVLYNPLFTNDHRMPFMAAATRADKFFDDLSEDNRNRVKTSAAGRSKPRAAVRNITDAVGENTQSFGRARDRKDPTAF